MCLPRPTRSGKWLCLVFAAFFCVASVNCVDSRIVTGLFTNSVADFVTGSAAIFFQDALNLRIPNQPGSFGQ